MGENVLGRTNLEFPPVWLTLGLGADPKGLARLAVLSRVPLDISSNPALWGGHIRGLEFQALAVNPGDVERATSEKHAYDLVQAHLIETLCNLGRETLDFYLLRIRRALSEFQINGALAALEDARTEGHVRFVGLKSEGSPYAALSTIQFHDAFEVLMFEGERARATLMPLAQSKRIGTIEVGRGSPIPGHIYLKRVSSVEELNGALGVTV